ncbi:MAG: IPT/TIG domain-containing protein, partial [Solirubrobacteraceae bacterium]
TPFPTRNALQSANAGGANDVFVAKLNAAGNDLLYSTYLGGTGSDRARGIAADATGAAYVTGYAASTNFPTVTAIDAGHNGGDDAFVSKLTPNGSALVFSTYLGTSGTDGADAIAVNQATGDAYVTGSTAAGTYPVTAGAFQTTGPAGTVNTRDAFVSRVKSDGTALVYSTFLGGGAVDSGLGVAVDAGGAAYVTGATNSDNFPLQAPLQGARKSVSTVDDAFVTKLNAAGSAAVYSTYFGGSQFDQGSAIAVDSTGAAYIGGVSQGDFPQVAPFGNAAGNQDAMVAKLDPSGASVIYASLLGGSDGDLGYGIAVDAGANAYVVGQANAYAAPVGNFPATPGAFQPTAPGGSEAFVTKVASAPSSPLVTSLRSRSGPATGGTEVTIGGTGLSGATAVRFGTTPARSFEVQSDTRIRAVSPAHDLGRTKLTVTTPAGVTPANPVATFEYAEGTWTLTGSLYDAHFASRLVGLEDGRVLLPSGVSTRNGPTIGSSEVYDPKTRSWTRTADIGTSRFAHNATLLGGPACRGASPPSTCGKVLVTGGYPLGVAGNQPVLDSAELFDPKTGTWSGTGAMTVRRALHPTILLDGPACHEASPPGYCGKVLAVGGRTCNLPAPATCATTRTNTAELYDPATGTWTATGPMLRQRSNLDLAILPDGKVLAATGFGTGASTTAEIYDPATGAWEGTGELRTRTRAGAAVLPDGRVLATSGFGAGNTSDIYDPASRTWSPAADMKTSYRFNYNYATMPSGKVIFAGGASGGETSEAYDPVANAWASTGLLNVARGYSGDGMTSRTVVLSSEPDRFAADSAECGNDCGKVLMAGDTDDKTAELYTPPPIVSGLDTTSGLPATPVKVTGQGFTHNVRAVLFGTTPASSFTVDSYGQLTAMAPAGSGPVRITVVNEGGQAMSAATFTHVAPAAPPPPPPPAPIGLPGPSTPSKPAAVARRRGRLSARLRPTRDLRAPFVFRLTGKLTLPRGVPASVGCRGRVTVRVQRGLRTIATRRPSLTRACTYRVRVSFAKRRPLRSATRLRFRARFGGNPRVLPTTAAARFGRIRR